MDSTQAELKRQLAQNPSLPDFYSVQAEIQTGGQGRQGRTWISPKGNLYLSFLMRGPHSHLTWIPHRVALALIESLIHLGVSAERVRIKWPNDLIVDRTDKLSGILCEKMGDHVLVGVGVNFVPVPGVLDRPTISLQEIMGSALSFTPNQLKETLLLELKNQRPLEVLQKNYGAHSLFQIGSSIRWRDEKTQKEFEGIFLGIGFYGEIKVQLQDQILALYSEEVHLIRV